MKVLICGGRDFTDNAHLREVMNDLHEHTPIITVISGCARGADTLGAMWAKIHHIPVERYPANWNLHGKAAGMMRNQTMLTVGKPELVVAFPGGKGTANMINIARKAGVTVYIP